MFKLSEIKDLIKLVDATSVSELEIENDGARLCIRKPSQSPVQAVSAQPVYAAGAPVPVPAAAAAAVQQPVQPAEAPASPAGTSGSGEQDNLLKIVSPMVGTFYASPSPGSNPYVQKGDKVGEHTVVCIIEAMKLMNEIEAEVKGRIAEVLVENGQLVEYGQTLFLVKPE